MITKVQLICINMDLGFHLKGLLNVNIRRMLFISTVIAIVIVFQYCGVLEIKTLSRLDTIKSPKNTVSTSARPLTDNAAGNDHISINLIEESENIRGSELDSTSGSDPNGNFYSEISSNNVSVVQSMVTGDEGDSRNDSSQQNAEVSINVVADKINELKNASWTEEERLEFYTEEVPSKTQMDMDEEGRTDVVLSTSNTSLIRNDGGAVGAHTNAESSDVVQFRSEKLNDVSTYINKSNRRKSKPPLTISQMNKILLKSYDSAQTMKRRWTSENERKLQSARMEIKNAPPVRNNQRLCASAFKNISVFLRSYELMEDTLKVYVYGEGDKPIFHEPIMSGIYASEGWFMKLIEESEKFTVRDPEKAHLFYIPFSSQMMRLALKFDKQHFHNPLDLRCYLDNHVKMIAERYSFWNRSRGEDHFVIACHDWAPKLTRNIDKSIRALCNADAGKDFKIGKDSSLPVTYIRVAEKPLKDLGGKPPSERSVLAFFAGKMHGYLRPILLQYWQNKEPDMAIFETFPRGNGTRTYREYMRSSKYCICAMGFGVHTPRIIESIYYECVPVILADNYVPPFFEVLNWEAFAVFVQEKDIPNLRNILLSIPEQKYLEMQKRVKQVQQHFLWHRKPVKYDIFHMILHSIWYNRVFRS